MLREPLRVLPGSFVAGELLERSAALALGAGVRGAEGKHGLPGKVMLLDEVPEDLGRGAPRCGSRRHAS